MAVLVLGGGVQFLVSEVPLYWLPVESGPHAVDSSGRKWPEIATLAQPPTRCDFFRHRQDPVQGYLAHKKTPTAL